MFKNKSFNVKMVDDPDKQTIFVPTRPIDYEKLNEVLKQNLITIGIVVGGVYVAKNLSTAAANLIVNLGWRYADTHFPYKPL